MSRSNAILVVGSTGNVGRALTGELVGENESVRAATRNPSGFKAAAGAEAVRFDYADAATFGPALEGTDRVFLIGPPSPEPHPVMIPFLQAATRPKRKLVLMTAMGTEMDEGGSLRRVELFLEQSGAPFVILRPNWFMDNFHTSWLEPVRQAGVIPLPAGDGRTSLIDARDIAASAAAALGTDRFDGRAFTLTGPEALTYHEAAAMVSAAAGREIRYVPLDDAAFIRSSTDAGVPADLAEYLAALFGFVRQGLAAAITPSVEELTGRAPRRFQQYAEDHAALWK